MASGFLTSDPCAAQLDGLALPGSSPGAAGRSWGDCSPQLISLPGAQPSTWRPAPFTDAVPFILSSFLIDGAEGKSGTCHSSLA